MSGSAIGENGVGIDRIFVPETFDHASTTAFLGALERTAVDNATSVVVLHGSEGVFCRGLNLPKTESGGQDEGIASDISSGVHLFAETLQRLLFLPKPVIAEVDGIALGGGLGVAAACDAVVATRRSKFGLPEMMFGLLPAIVTPVLLYRMTPQKIRCLALNCEAVDAAHALTLGLADWVVEEHRLPRTVHHLARRFSRADRGSVKVLKHYIATAAQTPAEEMLREGATLTASRLGNDTVKKRLATFLKGAP